MTFRTLLLTLLVLLLAGCSEERKIEGCDPPYLYNLTITAVYDSYDTEYECDILKVLTAKDVETGKPFDMKLGVADAAYLLLHDGAEYTLSDGIYYITDQIETFSQRENLKYLYWRYYPRQRSRSNSEDDNNYGCGTIASKEPEPFYPTLSRAASDSWIGVNCYVHVLRTTSHEGLALESTCSNILYILNNHFMDAKIRFSLKGSEHLDILTDSWIQTLSINDDLKKITAYNGHPDAIDIYVLDIDKSSNEKSSGVALDVFSTACVFYWKDLNRNVLTHEVGHCLGLYHTHEGTDGKDISKKELVNGTNADIAGDYLRDTPADPNIWEGGYYYAGGDLRDANGDKYKPDPENFMSYCYNMRSKFSPMQILKMHDGLLNNSILKKVVSTYSLEDNLHFKKQIELNVSGLLPLDNVDWTINRYSSINESGTTETVSRQSTLTLTSSKSEYFIVTAKVTAEDGATKTLVSELSSNEPSTTLGTLAWSVGINGATGGTNEFSYGSTLTVGSDLSLSIEYIDPAGAKLSGLTYRCVTATKRVLSGSTMRITKSDCADGFLKIRVSDDCGSSSGYFTILTNTTGGYYSLSFDTPGQVGIKGCFATSDSQTMKAPAAIPGITNIVVYDGNDKIVYKADCERTTSLSIPVAGWSSGEYKAIITDGEKQETIYFGV